MGNSKRAAVVNKNRKGLFIGVASAILLIAVIFIALINNANTGNKNETASKGTDIIIIKSSISQAATFIPYKVGNINMEIVAVKASDGTIRTAFNTCQVCYNSGRGYYKQEGDELVCQNCGNRFQIDQVELIKGGCNPVPILETNKIDNGTTITISKTFLEQNINLFGNWSKA